jgi:hypothetical protein
MQIEEQTAFIKAYNSCIGEIEPSKVQEFISKYSAGENIQVSGDYISITNALMMWHSAMKFSLTK